MGQLESSEGVWSELSDVAQGTVAGDDVGKYLLAARLGEAKRAQGFEERLRCSF